MLSDKNCNIDKIAYELYKNRYFNTYGNTLNVISIDFFIFYKDAFFRFYDKAENILRKEKLEKINEIQ